ncbi:MAG: tripartite tricarboxylate transporter substrate binding protein [Comamonas sp.]|jgi:tripartite-type tricarboxylate transporter receptor subunit TctC|nr:tripartite tricarboxylate transporter substrate binding protein [Comamonas sp.]
MQRRQFLMAAGAAGAAGALPALAADGYPERSITLIVPYGAGGPTDTHIRAVAEAAGKLLGQSIVIDNRAGANGVNAAAALAQPRTAADGYTLGILPASVYREPHMQKTAFDPRKSFSYIALLSDYAFGLAVRADAPYKSWADLAAAARKQPGKLNIGATGALGTPRIVMDEIADMAGLQYNVVPYKGDAELATALLGGHIDAAPLSGIAVPHIESGKLRYLAMLTPERIKRYPQLPTLREAGVNAWIDSPYGVAGPAGMDAARVQKLSVAFRQALNSPASLQALEQLNQPLNYLDPKAYQAYALQAYVREEARVAKLRQRGLVQ